ncbi:MAG: acyl carrier protein [Candidatus Phytoplasma pruni]|uniref:acyl carrier protein n=1 Tax=16SrIII (X-disease group) TaxID=85623 RepID=UPI000377B3B8|nr:MULTISPECIES: acyl carrier protein [16SrIII (X-disease group)]
MLTKIQEIISEQLFIPKEKIMLKTRLKEDLGIDSIDAVNLVFKLEQIFNIKISDEALQQFKTIQEVCDFVELNSSK